MLDQDEQTTLRTDRSRGLGKIGIWTMELRFGDPSVSGEVAAELEEMGYGAIWIPGGIGGDVEGDVDRLLNATRAIPIGTGIINIYKHEPADIGSWFRGHSATDQARLMLGLGVSHGPLIGEGYEKPIGKMTAYLDALDAAGLPAERRCIAALGPKMLELARDRSAGSHPFLVTPEFSETARGILGPDALLAPEQGVILETDPATARAMGRAALGHYLHLPNYLNSWRRMGFTEEDVTQATDRLVDGLFAWGTPQQIAERVRAHLDAGADHVCMQVIHAGAATMSPPRDAWRALAEVLL